MSTAETSKFPLRSSSKNDFLPTSNNNITSKPSQPISPSQSSPFYGRPNRTRSHSRSISEAFGKMRARSASVTAGEVMEFVKAPVSWKLVVLCLIWYMSSAMTNTSSKSILNGFPRPITLTLIQFMFVMGWCVVLSKVAQVYPALGRAIPALQGGLMAPTEDIIRTTAPMAVFQVVGHILSSIATGRIAVSLVHTIKGMSPLFTVFAYRYLFNVHYSPATYFSLIPLTVGVMLACSVEFRGNFVGIICAFTAAIVFVWQNIYSKKIFNASNQPSDPFSGKRNIDKLNLLCYSSGFAFILTLPIWLFKDGFTFIGQLITEGGISVPLEEIKHKELVLTGMSLVWEFIFNGAAHFGQNIIAFVLLSIISPVTYSVASLIKRIFVIVLAIVWFRTEITSIQWVGIALTFFGLYLYDRAGDVSRKEKAAKVNRLEPILPTANEHHELPQFRPAFTSSIQGSVAPINGVNGAHQAHGNGLGTYGIPPHQDGGLMGPYAPRQQDTWMARETKVQ